MNTEGVLMLRNTVYYQNRIKLLMNRETVNSNIIRKLQRQLRKLENANG